MNELARQTDTITQDKVQTMSQVLYALQSRIPPGRGFASTGTAYRNGYLEALATVTLLVKQRLGLLDDGEVARLVKSLPRPMKTFARAIRERVNKEF